MAHLIDWDNIHLHMHDNDVRYKRRLYRKQLYIDCSPSIYSVSSVDGSSKKLKTVKDQNFMGNDKLMVACPNNVSDPKPIRVKFGTKRNDVDPDLKMFKEGLREGGQSLVFKVDNNASSDASLKKLETVQDQFFMCNDKLSVESSSVVSNPKLIRVKCGTKGNAVDPDSKMFKDDLREEGLLFASFDVSLKKLEIVQDRDLRNDELRVDCCDVKSSRVNIGSRRMIVDPDYKMFMENVKEDGHSFGSKVDKNDGSFKFSKYEKDVLRKEYRRKSKGDKVKNALEKQKGDKVENALGKQKGDTAKSLRNNIKKEKGGKVVQRGDVNFVSSKEKRNTMLQREGFSVNSDRSTVTKRSSVVKRGDNMEIISIEEPNEIEKVRIGKKNRPSKIIKSERPLNLDDGRDMEYLRKSKRIKYQKVERRPCLTRIDKVSNMMNIADKVKRHLAVSSGVSAKYQRTGPRNKQKYPVVQQDVDIGDSKFISGIGKMDAMVKEENFDDNTNVVLVKKRRQMIQGRDIIYNPNLREQNKREEKFGKHAKVKEENANILNYDEEDNEHSSDLEILEMDNQQNLSKFEVTKVFNASVIEDYPLSMESPSDYETPEFREKLMDILQRPYNQEEYKSLMQRAKYRHLKGGPEYSDGLKGRKVSDTYGKSLLDYHPDVKRRLRQCRNLSKRLNILRGFIYWSEKTCQDGAFKPWLDKSCLAVTPSPH